MEVDRLPISRLFQIDARARCFHLDDTQHQALRTRYSVPVLTALWARAAQELSAPPLERCVTTSGARLDNNLVENSIRPIKLGEANWLFIGAPTAGPRLAHLYTLVENCRLSGVDPEAYLVDIITRLLDHPANRLPELLPHAWKAAQAGSSGPSHSA